MTKTKRKKVDKLIKLIIKDHRRALLGFAHYDKGVKVKGCDCCYCQEGKSVYE